MVIRGVVFDIDDTLYLERDYVRSGFRHVAAVAGRSPSEREELAQWLIEAFDDGMRGHTFERLLEAFPAVARRCSVEALVEAYRNHRPSITLSPGIGPTLDALRSAGLRLGVLSDGTLASQEAKAEVLDLRRWFDPIVFTASLGPGQGKPALTGFQLIARAWGFPSGSIAYVGDNPEKDFTGPRALGWLTVRLRQPGQLHDRQGLEVGPPAAREIREAVELINIVVSARRSAIAPPQREKRRGPR